MFDHSYPLDYATQFSADCYEGGYVMIDIPDAGRFLVVPEGAAEVDDLPEDVVLLRQPLDHIYLVSTSVMDLFVHLDALDSIALSGTKAEGWYVEEARQAMQEGRIAYAGKYSAPDYERILAADCTLAIENTMVLHDPRGQGAAGKVRRAGPRGALELRERPAGPDGVAQALRHPAE